MKFLLSWSNPKSSYFAEEDHFVSFRGYTDKEIKDILSLPVKGTWKFKEKDPICTHIVKRIN